MIRSSHKLTFQATSGKTYCKDNNIELYKMIIDYPEDKTPQEEKEKEKESYVPITVDNSSSSVQRSLKSSESGSENDGACTMD